jgi:hypothetical protein
MIALLLHDLRQLRLLLGVSVVLAAVLVLLGFAFRDQSDVTPLVFYLDLGPFIIGLVLPQTLFASEDRNNSLRFLRSLPVHPRWIVSAKYLALALGVVMLPALLLPLKAAGIPWRLTAADALTTAVMTGAGLLVGAISLFFHFWLGSKTAKTGPLVFLGTANILGMLAVALATGDRRRILTKVIEMLGTAGFRLGLLIVAMIVMAISHAGAASLFERRDLTALP